MNLFHELTFLGAKVVMAALVLTVLWGVSLVLRERHAKGNVDAFKPERRVGRADRRATLHVP
jgi:hypothetical protein